jgi:hypothetical protein
VFGTRYLVLIDSSGLWRKQKNWEDPVQVTWVASCPAQTNPRCLSESWTLFLVGAVSKRKPAHRLPSVRDISAGSGLAPLTSCHLVIFCAWFSWLKSVPTYSQFAYFITSWGSSVSTVSDYRVYVPTTGFRSPAEVKDFSCSLCVQTNSEIHPASYTMGTGDLSPGVKALPGRDADHSPLSRAEANDE